MSNQSQTCYIINSSQAEHTTHYQLDIVCMYEIKLVYDPEPKTLTLKESVTYCATIELFLRGIHTYQASATRIGFESDRDRTLGMLILSSSTSFRCVCL